jgi:type I site-specific restriction-modification system R (restriction) subunit
MGNKSETWSTCGRLSNEATVYSYLRPQEVYLERKGKLGNVLLEGILADQLKRLNRVRYRGKEQEFTQASIQSAIQSLKEIPFDGLVRTSEQIYDLLSLGKALEQTVDGDTKSFTLQYIDWRDPNNNVFHVAEEFEVERTGSKELCRPDIVLFVNGIPLSVIECKHPGSKEPLAQAVYDRAATPLQRVLARAEVSAEKKTQLRQMHQSLNPFALRRQIDKQLKEIDSIRQLKA